MFYNIVIYAKVSVTMQEADMINSMTGFGRCEFADEQRRITVELKSVNHRYLDVNIKMPKRSEERRVGKECL